MRANLSKAEPLISTGMTSSSTTPSSSERVASEANPPTNFDNFSKGDSLILSSTISSSTSSGGSGSAVLAAMSTREDEVGVATDACFEVAGELPSALLVLGDGLRRQLLKYDGLEPVES